MAKKNKKVKANRTTYIEDGYLVVGDVSQSGCTSYRLSDRDVKREGDQQREEWNTKKLVLSVEEQRAVSAVRRVLRRKVTGLGASIAGYGVYVPSKRGADLDGALRAIDEEARAYNRKAKYTRLSPFYTVFTIEGGDERVARALYDRAISLVNELSECVANGDVKGIRRIASDMVGLDTVLDQTTAGRISETIDAARKAARAATKKLKNTSGSKDQKLKKVMAELETLDVSGIRASLVETIEQVDEGLEDQAYVPDLVSVRQVETKAPAKKGKRKKAAPRKRSIE